MKTQAVPEIAPHQIIAVDEQEHASHIEALHVRSGSIHQTLSDALTTIFRTDRQMIDGPASPQYATHDRTDDITFGILGQIGDGGFAGQDSLQTFGVLPLAESDFLERAEKTLKQRGILISRSFEKGNFCGFEIFSEQCQKTSPARKMK